MGSEVAGERGAHATRPAASPALAPDPALVASLRGWELQHPLREDGTGDLIVKESSFPGGGLGCFATSTPRPIEYMRDIGAPHEGWLDPEEVQKKWDMREEVAMYSMEVTLGSDWFRDESPEGGGRLRPMQDLHEIVRAGQLDQAVEWRADDQQYVFLDRADRVTYAALRSGDPSQHPAPCINDALFGLLDGNSDAYTEADRERNAFVMVPCLRSSSRAPDKLELSSVWFYPRSGWDWARAQEVTVGYHWPLEPWMTHARLAAGLG